MQALTSLRCGEHDFNEQKIYVMGVVNVTPDSFSDGGRYCTVTEAVDHAQRCLDEGADILDIGGLATSPQLNPLNYATEEEELCRVVPVIEALSMRGIRNLCVDTPRARVARAALDAGASWINDQTAALSDPAMASVMTDADAVVLMHKSGVHTGVDAGSAIVYVDVIDDLLAFFRARIEAVCAAGVARERIVVDPGIGFGKGLQDSLTIINNMHRFNELGVAHVIGISRKSFLYPMTGIKNPGDRDFATLGAHAAAILSGARIIRTHNVRATVEMAKVFGQCLLAKENRGHGENLH